MAVATPPQAPDQTPAVRPDDESRRWVSGLRDGSRQRDQTIASLHALLLRVARHEVHRRRAMLGNASGPELDDLAQQAADDALMTIISKIDEFRGASRFTTWAYKFALFEVSASRPTRLAPPGPRGRRQRLGPAAGPPLHAARRSRRAA